MLGSTPPLPRQRRGRSRSFGIRRSVRTAATTLRTINSTGRGTACGSVVSHEQRPRPGRWDVSYRTDLDEYSEATLKAELARRRELRKNGRCDYCQRPEGVSPCCKFPDRHGGNFSAMPHPDAKV